MPEPAWATFAGIVAFVTVAIVALARLSAGEVMDAADVEPHEQPTPGMLLVNVAISQGLLGVLLALGAWYAQIPLDALGLGPEQVGLAAVGVGLAVGVALYAGDELLMLATDRAGVAYSEGMRELLAPDTPGGWLLLVFGALPIVAAFEELLFRAALVGAMAAGFGVSPWLLAVASSLVFGVAHSAQGSGGMAVATGLGFALAAVFVLTESLVVVVVAHWLVNTLEFGVHEALGVEWTGRRA